MPFRRRRAGTWAPILFVLMALPILSMACWSAWPSAPAVYLGVWQPFGNAANLGASVSSFEKDAGGKHVAIVQFYNIWPNTVDTRILAAIHNHGSTPLVTLNPGKQPLAAIAAGKDDRYYRRWADDLRSFQATVLFRWGTEMNGTWFPWCVAPDPACHQTPADYIAAWRHIHDLFVAAGATNVQWVWCPNVVYPIDHMAAFESMFPGDRYVDWVGLDGYNVGNGRWASFTTIFGDSYQRLVQLSRKPVMIAEVASAEGGPEGARKAAWITDALTRAIPSMSHIRAVVWFNENQTAANGHDWRIESSTTAQKAFAAAVAHRSYLSTAIP